MSLRLLKINGELHPRIATSISVFRILPLLLALFLWVQGPRANAAGPDAAVQQRILTRLARSSLRHDTVSVRVVGGVATLEGAVVNVQRKGVATRLARESGAAQVINLLKVNDGKPEAPLKIVRVLP